MPSLDSTAIILEYEAEVVISKLGVDIEKLNSGLEYLQYLLSRIPNCLYSLSRVRSE
jgi:hypothetical protein